MVWHKIEKNVGAISWPVLQQSLQVSFMFFDQLINSSWSVSVSLCALLICFFSAMHWNHKLFRSELHVKGRCQNQFNQTLKTPYLTRPQVYTLQCLAELFCEQSRKLSGKCASCKVLSSEHTNDLHSVQLLSAFLLAYFLVSAQFIAVQHLNVSFFGSKQLSSQ